MHLILKATSSSAALLIGQGFSARSIPAIAELLTHPGFQIEAAEVEDPTTTTLEHINGFGVGNHWTFEVDPTNEERMVIEPGETTERWYFDTEANGGWTWEAIKAEESLSQNSAIDVAEWLVTSANTGDSANHYGYRSDKPLSADSLLAMMNQAAMRFPGNETPERRVSAWMDIASGVTASGNTQGIKGESPLHPAVFGSLEPGNDPFLFQGNSDDGNPSFFGSGMQNVAFVNVGIAPNSGHSHFSFNKSNDYYAAFIDCDFDDHAVAFFSGGGCDKITMYATNVTYIYRRVPDLGTEWNGNLDRESGTYIADSDGPLRWKCFYDHCGWMDGYDPTTQDYDGGNNPQPPSYFSHNLYDSQTNEDLTITELVSTRAGGTSIQGRSGGYNTVLVHADNNSQGFLTQGDVTLTFSTSPAFTNGETFEGLTSGTVKEDAGNATGFAWDFSGPINVQEEGFFIEGETVRGQTSLTEATLVTLYQAGNYGLMNSAVAMGAGYNKSSIFQQNLEGAFGGLGSSTNNTLKNLISANYADPENAADVTERSEMATSDLTAIGMDASQMSGAYEADFSIWNWGSSANDTSDTDSLTTSDMDEVTIAGYVDLEMKSVAIGTTTVFDAIDYISDNVRRPGTIASDIWNFAAERFGRTTIGHTGGATAVFTPDPNADGFRMDGMHNWKISGGPDGLSNKEDWPVDGDDCDLNGNLAFNYRTFRFGDLDFGAGGGIRIYGGLISCASSQAISRGSVELLNAGKFRVSDTQTTNYDVTADNGRYEVDGTISGVSGTFSGQSQCIVYAGGDFTVSDGETLIIDGNDVKAGFDGQSGSATITVESGGTLRFVLGAARAQGAYMRKVRTGRFGFEDLGGGVTGQTKEPNLTANVVFDSGAILEVDNSAGATGTPTLISVDSVTDNGAIKDAGITVGASEVTYAA